MRPIAPRHDCTVVLQNYQEVIINIRQPRSRSYRVMQGSPGPAFNDRAVLLARFHGYLPCGGHRHGPECKEIATISSSSRPEQDAYGRCSSWKKIDCWRSSLPGRLRCLNIWLYLANRIIGSVLRVLLGIFDLTSL